MMDAHLAPRTVLVVDDDPDINRLLQVRLRNLGFQVISARNGEEALAEIATAAPDLMLLDVSMPGIGGMEVLHDIRTRKLDIAVIMTTAFGSEGVAIEALRNGANDYLRKPFATEEFRAVVNRTAQQLLLQRQVQQLRHQLDAELRHASEIQRSLLPARPPEVPGFEIASRCIPARDVGGDFYDWHTRADGAFGFTLGDVMGKGMPAALLMTTVRAALRSTAPYHDPAGTLQVVNRALWDDLDRTASFVTIFHAALYPERGEFHFVDAGQGLAACVSEDGTTHPLGCTGLPIGIEPDPQILGGIVHPAPGDAIVICSDGIVESIPDLAALLHGSGTHRSVHNILDAMFDPTRAAMPAADDRTALVIRRKVS